jgi:hypothetical protein
VKGAAEKTMAAVMVTVLETATVTAIITMQTPMTLN